MKILLIGEKGQLAWELIRSLMPVGEVVSLDYPAFDITNKSQIEDTVSTIQPELVINASAYTDVDGAENDRDRAMAVNAEGPGWLAGSCHSRGIPLIHYSTDFVFDGTGRTPYVETDIPNPINFYGVSKLKGEQAIQNATDAALIFRLAWLYSARGNNFIHKFLSWAEKNETIKVVHDQVGNPTWARFVAEATASLLAQSLRSGERFPDWMRQRAGLYHLSSGGEASRYDWACEIWKNAPDPDRLIVKDLVRAKSTDFPTPALRPAYSPMDCDKFAKTFGLSVPDWRQQQFLCMAK